MLEIVRPHDLAVLYKDAYFTSASATKKATWESSQSSKAMCNVKQKGETAFAIPPSSNDRRKICRVVLSNA